MGRKIDISLGHARIAYVVSRGTRVPCKLYDAWQNMRRRVLSNHPRVVPYYRDKGIKSHPAWDDYEVFRAWGLATGFRRGMTLDRIDGNGHYEPSNCRWVTRGQQQDNSAQVIYLTLNGVTKSLPVWARELGVKSYFLRTRYKEGWTHEQILTTPKLTNGQVRAGVQHQPRGRKPKSAHSAQ
jgi:hypothetical protein